MKVGSRTYIYNQAMRQRRLELGMSQSELADLSGTNITQIGLIESLSAVSGGGGYSKTDRLVSVRAKLQKIADVLEIPFDEVFTPDYLQMLQDNVFPNRRKPFVWVQEISLDALPPSQVAKLLPNPDDLLRIEDDLDRQRLRMDISEAMESLTHRQREVIEWRFGLRDGKTRTLEEVGQMYGMTRTRVWGIEDQALRILRHSNHSRKFKKYLYY